MFNEYAVSTELKIGNSNASSEFFSHAAFQAKTLF